MEKVELRQARSRYERAVSRHTIHRNSSSAGHYEALGKLAFTRLMSLETQYAGRE